MTHNLITLFNLPTDHFSFEPKFLKIVKNYSEKSFCKTMKAISARQSRLPDSGRLGSEENQ